MMFSFDCEIEGSMQGQPRTACNVEGTFPGALYIDTLGTNTSDRVAVGPRYAESDSLKVK